MLDAVRNHHDPRVNTARMVLVIDTPRQRVFTWQSGADEILLGYPGHQLSLLWTYIEKLPFAKAALGAFSGIDQGRGASSRWCRFASASK